MDKLITATEANQLLNKRITNKLNRDMIYFNGRIVEAIRVKNHYFVEANTVIVERNMSELEKAGYHCEFVNKEFSTYYIISFHS